MQKRKNPRSQNWRTLVHICRHLGKPSSRVTRRQKFVGQLHKRLRYGEGAKNGKPTFFRNWLTPLEISSMYSPKFLRLSMLPTNGQNLVHVEAIAFRLDKIMGWANAKSKHARLPQARSKLDTSLTTITTLATTSSILYFVICLI